MTAKHWKTFALIAVLMITGVLLVVATSPNQGQGDTDTEVSLEASSD